MQHPSGLEQAQQQQRYETSLDLRLADEGRAPAGHRSLETTALVGFLRRTLHRLDPLNGLG